MSGIAPDDGRSEADGRTTLARFAARVAEWVCLAALLVAPLYLNLHSERVFEEDKVPFIRSLALLAIVGLVVWLAEGDEVGERVRRLLGAPLVRPALALTLVYCISTLASTIPTISFFGAYHRLQGTYTFLSYLPFFLVTLALPAGSQRAQRIVSVVLFGSLPVALYASLQYLRHDPMPWAESFATRAYSTMGNPIFLGSYLVAVIPLTVVRIVDRGQTGWTSAAGYAVLLAAQLVALAESQSRGPVLALGAGLAMLGLALTVLHRKRWPLIAMGAAIAAAAVAVVARPLHLGDKGFVRLLNVIDASEGSGRVRTLIWEGASNLILSSGPLRLSIGYGPESELSALTPHNPSEIGHYESRRVLPDRAHNEAIDAMVTIGVLGCAAEFLVFIAFFHCVLRSLGLIRNRSDGAIFVGLAAGGALAGALLAYAIDGSLRFSGLAVHGAVVLALVVFLVARGIAPDRRGPNALGSDDLLLVGLLAAVAAHLVEIALAIAIVAPRLYFWTYAGIAAALRIQRRTDETSAEPVRHDEPALGVLAGLVLCILTVDFFTPNLSADHRVLLLLTLALPTWIGGALLLGRREGNRLGALATYAADSLMPSVAFAAIVVWWLNWQPSAPVDTADLAIRFAQHIAHAVTWTYVAVISIVLLSAALAVRIWARRSGGFARSPRRAAAYALLALVAGALIVTQNLSVSRADVLAKQATFYERSRRFDLAAAITEEAIRLRPSVDQYYSNVGREYLEHAKAVWSHDPARGRDLIVRAEAALERARSALPALLDHTRNLARLHHSWLELASDPEERAAHLRRADALYDESAALAPTSAPLLNEWALMYLAIQERARARDLLDRSISVDDRYVTTYWVRANLRASEGDLVGALGDYDRALAIRPFELAALSGKGGVLVQLGRLDDAIQVNRTVLRYKPRDLIGLRNLALLYREKGDTATSLDFARRARAAAPAAEQPALDTFIAEVEGNVAVRPPP